MSETNIFTRSTPRENRRVVVTGLGAITPLGANLNSTWERLLKGESGIGRITVFDPETYSSQIAGEVSDFNADEYVIKKDQKKMGRFIHFALGAATMAFKDAGIEFDEKTAERTGSIVGVGIGGLPNIEKQTETVLNKGPGRISPFYIPAVLTNMAAGHISIRWGLKGPNYSVTSACASGNHSIGEAYNYIRGGLCDVMIAGGAEGTVCPTAVGGFAAMKALSTRNSQPEAASRPWDKERDGFVLSEGCGLLVLEDYEHAAKRGAKIYAELRGYGASSDGHHITNPHPEGAGAALAMKRCLADGELNPEDISYINAHGTSTPMGDELEAKGIKKVFGNAVKNLWVSSTKSMIGHTLGAAGAIESVFSVMSLHHNVAPPTINLDNPSEDCDLDFVPHTARERQMTHVLNNSFGFGGTNGCVVFSRV